MFSSVTMVGFRLLDILSVNRSLYVLRCSLDGYFNIFLRKILKRTWTIEDVFSRIVTQNCFSHWPVVGLGRFSAFSGTYGLEGQRCSLGGPFRIFDAKIWLVNEKSLFWECISQLLVLVLGPSSAQSIALRILGLRYGVVVVILLRRILTCIQNFGGLFTSFAPQRSFFLLTKGRNFLEAFRLPPAWRLF